MQKNKLLGIDPGRSKTGVALLNIDGCIISTETVLTEKLSEKLLEIDAPVCIVIGNGTNSSNIEKVVKAVFENIPIEVVEESYSTEEARPLYWECNPPQGWRKLMPLGMLTPPEPLDGYAAAILVKRYLQQNKTAVP